jgi:rubrerythrin
MYTQGNPYGDTTRPFGGMMPGGYGPTQAFPIAPGGYAPGGYAPGGYAPGGYAPGGLPFVPVGPAEGEDLFGLVQRVERYIQDQVTAAAFYRELAGQIENEKVKSYLLEAMRDEQKHEQLLRQLYQRITGQSINAQPTRVTFASPREGLLKAIDGEIDAYEAYKTEYQRFEDREIRRLFFDLFSDEIEHATRFNTALHILAWT